MNILPRVMYYPFPEGEQEAVKRTDRALISVASHIDAFKAALALHDFCAERLTPQLQMEEHSKMLSWKFIAGRDGALQLFHVGRAVGYVDAGRKSSQTLTSYMNLEAFDNALKLFDSISPSYINIRHAVGHTADFADKPRKHEATGGFGKTIPGVTLGDNATVMVSEGFEGRKFYSTVDGKPVYYDLSEDTVTKLDSVLRHFGNSFEPVHEAIRQLKDPKTEKLERREHGEQRRKR